MNKILIVAQKEFRDGLRNRWTGAITIIFILMSLGLAYFGSATAGVLGFSSLESTLVSLASLCVMLIPLIALMLALPLIHIRRCRRYTLGRSRMSP